MKRAAQAWAVLLVVAAVAPTSALPAPGAPRLDAAAGGSESLAQACLDPERLEVIPVVALQVPVSYNHWGDFDPQGRLFVRLEKAPDLLANVSERLATAGLLTAERVALNALELNHLREFVFASINASTENLTSIPGYLEPPPQTTPIIQALQNATTRIVQKIPNTLEKERDDILGEAGINPDYRETINSTLRLDRFDVSPQVQPFVVRAHVGDCVLFVLYNALPEPVSLHVHGVATRPGQGLALGENDADLTPPGAARTYLAYVPDLPGMEGAHFLHSHADSRFQTKHGLFGALVAEPKGARWFTPEGRPSRSGVEAILMRPDASDFREYVVLYHDEVELLNHSLRTLPVFSQYGEYGPGSKAINLRTEPFMDRFEHHDALFDQGAVAREHDKSQGYGSYTYGDPAAFIPRAYVGDPSKFRLVNAGPGQAHVHHLHGGGDRWRASPVSDDTEFDNVVKGKESVVRATSERIDVQLMSPGESFNAEIEGGAGGVQQSVGDFLFHCHIVEHYVGGMWSFWRVYNTLQPDLEELPDRRGTFRPSVNSTGLLGERLPDGTVLNATNLGPWIEGQLPPAGEPAEDDASVLDWLVEPAAAGPLYQAEPETLVSWPNYESPKPGERPELPFDPRTGRLAYPFLTPHFGKRPPFAPAHGPAPYLGPDADARHPDGLCPKESTAPDRHRDYRVVAFETTVRYNGQGDEDAEGQIFAHAEDKAAILDGTKDAKNLVLRANQGDCVDVLFTSTLPDTEIGPDGLERPKHSKVNMHIHLVQFDVQGSDGVITGLNYETSVRPATATGSSLVEPEDDGSPPASRKVLRVAESGTLRAGTLIGIGLGGPNVEVRRVESITEDLVTLDEPLALDHALGERVGPEFVRYRWYADVELGVVYWHDHVDGLNSWRHGLFGALVVEPAGSEWRDPKTGVAVREGTVVDIVNPADPADTFREFVLEAQDRSACLGATPGGCSQFTPGAIILLPPNPQKELASFNLRSEPLHRRNAAAPFQNEANGGGDPGTEILRAYAGDPVVIRLLYAGQSSTTGVATFALTGHRFQAEQHNPGSRLVDAVSVGISSHANLRPECGAGGCGFRPGDHLYYLTQPDLVRRGAWGLFRVYGPGEAPEAPLLPLPGHDMRAPIDPPVDAPVRSYDIVATEADVTLNSGALPPTLEEAGLELPPEITQVDDATEPIVRRLRLFALAQEEPAILDGSLRPAPLVLRALPGERVRVQLTNHLNEPVSLHPALVQATTPADTGLAAGRTPATAHVPPGAARTYEWYADREVGAAYLTSMVGPHRDPVDGLYGVLVVEPVESVWRDSATGEPRSTGPRVDLEFERDGRLVRAHEQVLVYASDDRDFQASVMPYTVDARGPTTVNYRTEALHDRVGGQLSPPAPLGELVPSTDPVGGMGLHPCQFDNDTCTPSMGGARVCDLVDASCALPPLGDQRILWAQKVDPAFEVRNPLNPWVYSSRLHGDPETPVVGATTGDVLVVRAVGGAGDQLMAHSVAGHWWPRDPGMNEGPPESWRSDLVGVATLGPREVSNAWMEAGPGGPGDYLWGSHRDAFLEAGAWGILRVRGPNPVVAPHLDLPLPSPLEGAPGAHVGDVIEGVAPALSRVPRPTG